MEALNKMPGFTKLTDDLMSNEKAWKKWYDYEKPELEDPPAEFKNLNSF